MNWRVCQRRLPARHGHVVRLLWLSPISPCVVLWPMIVVVVIQWGVSFVLQDLDNVVVENKHFSQEPARPDYFLAGARPVSSDFPLDASGEYDFYTVDALDAGSDTYDWCGLVPPVFFSLSHRLCLFLFFVSLQVRGGPYKREFGTNATVCRGVRGL